MKNATPKPGRPGEVSQWPRWEGPQESRPAGYMRGEDDAAPQEESHRGRSPEPEVRNDAFIEAQVGAQLEQNPLLDPASLQVSVRRRRVILDGVVDTPEASLRTEKDALSVEGVYGCENRFKVRESYAGGTRDG